MYNGIGLRTARGSGTNGYVQSNKFFVKPKPSSISLLPSSASISDAGAKKANKEILEHDRKRRIELRLIVLEETLADQGYTQAEIAEKLRETRAALETAPLDNPPEKRVSDTQTHQIAARKEKQLETFRAALGIKLGDESPKHDTEEQKHQDKGQGLQTEESGGEKDGEQNKLADGKQDHGDRERESSKKARATEEHRSKNELNDKKNREKKANEVEHKKMDTKKGRYKDVSASDSSREDVKNEKMKPSQNSRGLDSSYTDIRSSKKSSKISEKDKISSYLDSDEDSDSSSESGGEKSRKPRKVEKQRKYDSDSGIDRDDKRKRSHVRERPSRGRRYDHDESDSGHDSGRENTRKSNKYVKQQRRYDNEPEINEDAKKKKGHAKELPSRRRHDSDESESDSDSGMEDTRKTRKFVRKQRRYDSSSETDQDDGRKKAHVNETSWKRRHDADDSDSASDDLESDRGRKSKHYNDKRNKNDSETVLEKKSTKNKKILEKLRRHYSEDFSSGADDSKSHSSDSTSDGDSSDSSGSSGSSGYKRVDAKNGGRLKSIVEKDLSSGISRKDDWRTSQTSNEHRNRDHSSLLKKSEKNRTVEMRNDRKEVANNENQNVQGKWKIDEGRDGLPVLESRGSGLGKSGKMKESLEPKKDRENRNHRTHHERRDNQKRDGYKYRGNSQKRYNEDDYDRRHKSRDDRSRDDRSYNDSKRRKFESSRQYARSDRYDSDSGEDSKSHRRL